MLVADTTTLIAGTTPSITLAADTAHWGLHPAHWGLAPSLAPTSVPPCKPEPELRPSLLLHAGPVAHVDVYVDDYIGLAQGSRQLYRDTRRCIMHLINEIFAQPDERTPNRKEAVSEKKLNKGDGGWSQCKKILGRSSTES